jgi:hypothetical protein
MGHSNWKRENPTVNWHNLICENPNTLQKNPKTIRTNKIILKKCRIQNKYTKSLTFLHASGDLPEIGMKKTITLRMNTKIKINLTKEAKRSLQ